MESKQLAPVSRERTGFEWRLYTDMLVTRLFEEACSRWEREKKMSAQNPFGDLFALRGQMNFLAA